MTYEIVRKELGQRQFSMKEDPRLRGEGERQCVGRDNRDF